MRLRETAAGGEVEERGVEEEVSEVGYDVVIPEATMSCTWSSDMTRTREVSMV